MNLKKLLKRKLPVALVMFISERHFWKRNFKIYKHYKANLKKIHTGETDKMKIAFIVEVPEVWNSIRSVYEAAEKNNIDTLLLCIPNTRDYMHEYKINEEKTNKAKDFFNSLGMDSTNALCADGKWFDLKKYNPDYVIYTRPYDTEYPEPYKSYSVCEYTRICYIPYAFSQTNGPLFKTTFAPKFILSTYLTFAPSKIRLNDCKNVYFWQVFRKTNNFEYLGFPRFDLLKEFNNDNEKSIKTIAWLPRWSFNNGPGQKKSHFMDFYKPLMQFMQEHKDINLIIRPHPLMFQSIIDNDILTANQVDDIRRQIENEPNISLDNDKDYLPLLKKADVLISDFTSLLIEYFVSGKPIIYCDNSDGFNADAALMDSTLYHANDWDELEQILTELINGNDAEYDKRQQAIGQLMPQNAGKIGESIVHYLTQDYNKFKRSCNESEQ